MPWSQRALLKYVPLPWLCAEYQKGHTGTWLQPQAKLLKNVSTIGQSALKYFNSRSKCPKNILTLDHTL